MLRNPIRYSVSAVSLIAVLPFGAVSAQSVDPVSMAHSVGFLGCDELVAREFRSFSGSADGRIRVDSVGDGASINMTASFGRPGDNVLQTVVFVKSEKGCSSYAQTQITWSQSCNAVLAEFKEWIVFNNQADTAWVVNQGGVRGYFKQLPTGGCVQTTVKTGVLKAGAKAGSQ